jgi:hypothetical protein
LETGLILPQSAASVERLRSGFTSLNDASVNAFRQEIFVSRPPCYGPIEKIMCGAGMEGDDRVVQVSDSVLRGELLHLRQEHRDLDSAIEALQSKPRPDSLQIQRLKKRKLSLKDRISALEDKLLPDIIA